MRHVDTPSALRKAATRAQAQALLVIVRAAVRVAVDVVVGEARKIVREPVDAGRADDEVVLRRRRRHRRRRVVCVESRGIVAWVAEEVHRALHRLRGAPRRRVLLYMREWWPRDARASLGDGGNAAGAGGGAGVCCEDLGVGAAAARLLVVYGPLGAGVFG